MSPNRISSRQVDPGPLAWAQRRVGAGLCWAGDRAYGIHSWKSTGWRQQVPPPRRELPAVLGVPPTAGPIRLWCIPTPETPP